MSFLQLDGKSILVFGVANRKSVAFHTGRLLEEAGATVIYVVRSEERRRYVAKLLPPNAELYVCDVEHEEQIRRLRRSCPPASAHSRSCPRDRICRLHGG